MIETDLQQVRRSSASKRMKPLSTMLSDLFHWKRSGFFGRRYELHHANEVLARLSWLDHSGLVAYAESAEGEWTFLSTRFIVPRIVVRTLDLDFVASFESRQVGSGTLNFLDGRSYKWLPINAQETRWGFQNGDRFPLLEISPKYHPLRSEASVHVAAVARGQQELALMCLLGWHLLLLRDV